MHQRHSSRCASIRTVTLSSVPGMIVLGMIAVMCHAGHMGMTAVSHRQRCRNRADAGTQNDRKTAVGANARHKADGHQGTEQQRGQQ